MADAAHPRDRVRDPCCPLPGVKRGRFEVYLRTDGLYVVYDPLRPATDRGVPGSVGTLQHATAVCDRQGLAHPGEYS